MDNVLELRSIGIGAGLVGCPLCQQIVLTLFATLCYFPHHKNDCMLIKLLLVKPGANFKEWAIII